MQNNHEVSKVKKITISGIVIAVYVAVMFLAQSFAFGAYQIRIATSIYSLASLYPFLIVPLGLSNFRIGHMGENCQEEKLYIWL